MNDVIIWSPDELQHHGVMGQKWGVRRYQNYDGSLIGSSKYKNIDGSINERGIDRKEKFVLRKKNKNEKYYDKSIKKLQKKMDKATTDEEKEYYKNRIDNANKTRAGVNDYLNKMDIDDIITREKAQTQKALKVAGTVAGAAGLATAGVLAPRLMANGIKTAGSFLKNIDPSTTMESIYAMAETPAGKEAMRYVDTGIRAYSDVRAYTFSIAADQAMNRLEQQGTLNRVGNMLSDASVRTVNNTYNGINNNMYDNAYRYANLAADTYNRIRR